MVTHGRNKSPSPSDSDHMQLTRYQSGYCSDDTQRRTRHQRGTRLLHVSARAERRTRVPRSKQEQTARMTVRATMPTNPPAITTGKRPPDDDESESQFPVGLWSLVPTLLQDSRASQARRKRCCHRYLRRVRTGTQAAIATAIPRDQQ